MPGLAIESGIDIACVTAERLIELACPCGERVGDGAVRLLKISGRNDEAADDTFLKLSNTAIKTRRDFVGARAKQGIELLRLSGECFNDRSCTRGHRRIDFPRLFVERTNHVSAAFAERSCNVEGPPRQRLAKQTRARFKVLIDPRDKLVEGLGDLPDPF